MQRVYDLAVTCAIIAVPLFIFMASLLERSGIARDMYDALNVALGRMRGGVAVVATVMAVIMAAMSGIIGPASMDNPGGRLSAAGLEGRKTPIGCFLARGWRCTLIERCRGFP